MVRTVGVTATVEGTANSCDTSVGRPTQATVTGVASSTEMLGNVATATVVSRVASSSARGVDDGSQTVAWSPIGFYNAGISDGSANYNTSLLWSRFFPDTHANFEFYLKLGRKANGTERVTWQVLGASDYADFVTFDETRVNASGTLEMAPKAGLDYHRIVVSFTERDGWFAPRLIRLRLLDSPLIEKDNVRDLVFYVYSTKTPPLVVRTSTSFITATAGVPWSITYQLQNPDGTGYDMAKLIDTPEIYLGFNRTSGPIGVPYPKGFLSGYFTPEKLTWTSATNTQTFNVTNSASYTPHTSDAWFILPHNELYDPSPRSITTINPANGVREATQYIHGEQNLWHWNHDFPRLGTENYPDGGEGRTPGYPTGLAYGGSIKFNPLLEDVSFTTQKAAPPVVDWYTGNPITYAYESANVKLGPTYVRQFFTVAYVGGPFIGPENRKWVRAAKHVEPFKTADVAHQVQFVRVGYQARNSNRAHQVVFKMRNVQPEAGYSAFGPGQAGDTTLGNLPQATIRVQGVFAPGEYIELRAAPGWSIPYQFTAVSGTPGYFQFNPGTTNQETAQNLVNSINQDGNGILVGARLRTSGTGDIIDLYRCDSDYNKATRLVNPGLQARKSLVSVVAPTSNVKLDPAYMPLVFTGGFAGYGTFIQDPFVVDASGNPCGPEETPQPPGYHTGATGEYFVDERTGTEFWFWSMRNMWCRNRNTPDISGTLGSMTRSAPDRLTDSAWGVWYGVAQTSAGVVCWMMNYHADKPVGFNPDSGSPPYADNSDVCQFGEGTSGPTKIYDAVDFTTHPPTRSLSTGATTGWLLEDAANKNKALDDAGYTNTRGWSFRNEDRCTMVDFPIYVNEDDGSDKTLTFEQLRDGKYGLLQYSMDFRMNDDLEWMRDLDRFAVAHTPYMVRVQQGSVWAPLGNCLVHGPDIQPATGATSRSFNTVYTSVVY